MDPREVQNRPSHVAVQDGNVTLTAPDGTTVVLTPTAAEETSDRLWKGAMFARGSDRSSASGDSVEEDAVPAQVDADEE